ncbi:hypothetical protein Tco_0856476 [Tanacetum coccineum]|uniref:Uncharacterized protein n=1 Tax=Tanacetum coccineum TaxID=301880 RepID=A0ABQ5B7N4_9ASTR
METISCDVRKLAKHLWLLNNIVQDRASINDSSTPVDVVPNPIPQQPCNPPNRDDCDRLFQPMFKEYFNPPTIVISPITVAAAPRVVDTTESLVSTSIDLDAPSTSIPSTQEQEHSLIISQDSTSHGSSSNVRPTHTPFEHLGRWTKDHPIENVIGFVLSLRESNSKLTSCGVILMPS